MSDDYRPAWCCVCGEQTLHYVLAQGRLQCTEDGCNEVRDGGPNELWPAEEPPPPCPLCAGRGWVEARPDLDCYGCDGLGVARPGYLPTPIEETS